MRSVSCGQEICGLCYAILQSPLLPVHKRVCPLYSCKVDFVAVFLLKSLTTKWSSVSRVIRPTVHCVSLYACFMFLPSCACFDQASSIWRYVQIMSLLILIPHHKGVLLSHSYVPVFLSAVFLVVKILLNTSLYDCL